MAIFTLNGVQSTANSYDNAPSVPRTSTMTLIISNKNSDWNYNRIDANKNYEYSFTGWTWDTACNSPWRAYTGSNGNWSQWGSGTIDAGSKELNGVKQGVDLKIEIDNLPTTTIGLSATNWDQPTDWYAEFICFKISDVKLGNPGTPTITQNKTNYTISWSAASASGGSGSVTYRVFSVTDGVYLTSASTSTSATLSVPSYGYAYEYRIVAFYSGLESYSSIITKTFTDPYPTITKQPSITSLNPTSGKQTTATWSAAQVSNLQSYQIKYQYFVGPSSTYSDSYHVGTTTATSATITQAMIQQKCGSSFSGTCYIFVRAYWGNADDSETGGWSTPTGVAFTYDPVTLTAPTNFKISQSGTNVTFSWTASSASGGSGSVTYRVMQTTDGMSIGTTTGTSLTVAASSIGYAQLSFVVYAEYSNHTAGSSTVTFTVRAPSLTKPTNVGIVQNGKKYTISWTAATGQYGTGNVTYRIFLLTDGMFQTEASTSTSATLDIPGYDYMFQYIIYAYYSGVETKSDTLSYTFAHITPTITTQPTITTVNPTEGTQTTITWSAATVSDLGSYTLGYQYFVGPSSTYSDSYHVGTTTSQSATITQDQILSKCGSGFEGTCYLFVRAYWQNSDGSEHGGYVNPTAYATFTYSPHNTVAYYIGGTWVECIAYYYNGTSWVECVPYYYNGSSWVECSH